MAKIKKLKKGRGDSAVLENDDKSTANGSDDEDEDDATGVASSEESDADLDDTGDDEEETPKAAPKISAKGRRKAANLVQITMLKTIACPRIGNDDLLAITGVTHLRATESYFVPENAAAVLVDRKAAILNG